MKDLCYLLGMLVIATASSEILELIPYVNFLRWEMITGVWVGFIYHMTTE
jgi:hypothetical protein